MAEEPKRILLLVHHNAFREALATRLNQEDDLEMAWQAGLITDTRDVHLDGIDVALVDPLLTDGDGLELIRGGERGQPERPLYRVRGIARAPQPRFLKVQVRQRC